MEVKSSNRKKKNKPILNKYEKEMMLNLNIIKGVAVLIVLINFVLPIFENGVGVSNGFQWLVVLIHLKSLGNAFGYFEQKVPILSIGFARIFEIAFHTVVKSNPINWSFFIILLVVDFVYLFLLFVDKQSYEYIEEPYSLDKW